MYLKNISFEKFKSILLNHNINLFDHDFRIIYQNFKILDNNIEIKSNNLNGGSLIDKLRNFSNIKYIKHSDSNAKHSHEEFQFLSPFEIITNEKNPLLAKVNKKKTELLVESLKFNNFDKAKYICKKKFIPILV